MKIGDLVVYDLEKIPASVPLSRPHRLGVVIRVEVYPGYVGCGMPMATVKWNGIDNTMKHRQDILEVLSANR